MTRLSLGSFLASCPTRLSRGPVALIFVEDDVEIGSTLMHHLKAGFRHVVVFLPDAFDLPETGADQVIAVHHNPGGARFDEVVTAVAQKVPEGTWLYYAFNAEYLLFPFCEDRSVGEMLAFHAEERRAAMLTYVVDLYANDLDRFPNAVTLDEAWFDRAGYYALARTDPKGEAPPKERQLDFYGGLRWRFEEHVPADRRRIDRIALFRAKRGLTLRPDHTFSDEEYNTYACPWHHNLTSVVASFRTAKALKTNPGSCYDIDSFHWHNSERFAWSSQQLLDLGLMEPGQWF